MIHLRPSGAYRWSNCPAAPTFEDRVPPESDTDAAREGTCAAWVAERMLSGVEPGTILGATHANGWLVTADMIQHVAGYVDMIRARGGRTTAEQFVRLTDFIAGTLDASTSIEGGSILHVDDLKYGFKIVEIFENPQLIIYAAAELQRLGFPASITHAELGIYQPRAFHPDGIYRTWRIPVADLYAMARDLAERGLRCQEPNPVATPGRHCDNCRAATSCVALAHSVYAGYHVVEDRRQRRMTSPELVKELDFLRTMDDLLKARKSAVEAEAEERLKSGEHLHGWFLKPRFGHRKFMYPTNVVRWLTGKDPAKETLKTPAELERDGADVKVIGQLAETPRIGHKLDRMPENYIRKAFN